MWNHAPLHDSPSRGWKKTQLDNGTIGRSISHARECSGVPSRAVKVGHGEIEAGIHTVRTLAMHGHVQGGTSERFQESLSVYNVCTCIMHT